MNLRRKMGVVLVLMAAACGGEGVDLPEPSSIAKLPESDGQLAPAGARLPLPLRVVVRSSDGAAVPRAQVRWWLASGTGGRLSDSITVADGTGIAEAAFTLGPAAGEYLVRAELVVDTDKGVIFRATASERPVLTEVEPATFTGGDQIVIRGRGLTRDVVIEIAGVPAVVTTVSVTRTGLWAIVPPCLVPGPVDIVARLDGARSNSIQGTFQAASGELQLAVGEYASINPAAIDACATFPAAGADTVEYLFVPQATTSTAGVSALYRFRGNAASAAATLPGPAPAVRPAAAEFHDFLRRFEAEDIRPARGARVQPFGAPLRKISVGDTREFHVCADLECDNFEKITAAVRFVGGHAAIYEDDAAPSPLSQGAVDSLGAMFDRELYEVATRAFGAESDVDRNGLVIILMTPVVNGLTPRDECEQAVVTGFFFSFDVDPAHARDERSNQAEVFYALTPDPSGSVGCAHTAARIEHLVPVTFIHELQHMISYNQHVLIRGGEREELWLNEALSHLAEELGALHFLSFGDSAEFSRFAEGDLFDAYRYLVNPGEQFVLFEDGTGTLAERGAVWLFVRWLVDQHGGEITRRLTETGLRGAANVAAAAGEPFARLLAEWILANYVSDLPGFTAPVRLRHLTWDLRLVFSKLHSSLPQKFQRPFPLEPLAFLGGAFDVSGSLRAGSGDYYTVLQAPAEPGFTLRLTGPDGEPVEASVAARLNVIRIR
ncbi:MAG: IPT/TIG domain-containing protein [Gemmatimonadales bacterium]